MATQSGSTFAGKGTESDSPDGDLFSMLTSGANAVAAGAQAVQRALLDPSNPNAVSLQPVTPAPMMGVSQSQWLLIALVLVGVVMYGRARASRPALMGRMFYGYDYTDYDQPQGAVNVNNSGDLEGIFLDGQQVPQNIDYNRLPSATPPPFGARGTRTETTLGDAG